MKSVILCAGYGERLKPLTDILPKPLFPILGTPLLGHIIYYLKQFGIDEVCVNTHHLADKIHHYIGDGSKFGIKVNISHEPQILGIGGGIGAMRDFLKDDMFIVHNGDVLTNLDLEAALEFHNRECSLVTLILHDYPKFNNVAVSSIPTKSGFWHGGGFTTPDFPKEIVDIGNRLHCRGTLQRAPTELAFTGIAIMSKRIFNFLPSGNSCSIIDVYIELVKSHPGSLKGYVSKSHHWVDIGTIESYLEAHKSILVDRVPLLPRDLEWGGNIYIGKDSTVSPLARIDGFVSIGQNCVIEEGASLKNCIVWDNMIVHRNTIAENTVLIE